MKRRKALKKIEKALSVDDTINMAIADKLEGGNYLIKYRLRGQPVAEEVTQEQLERLECNTLIIDDISDTLKGGRSRP